MVCICYIFTRNYILEYDNTVSRPFSIAMVQNMALPTCRMLTNKFWTIASPNGIYFKQVFFMPCWNIDDMPDRVPSMKIQYDR